MSGAVIEIEDAKSEESGEVARAVYEHPLPVRLCHWVNSRSCLSSGCLYLTSSS